MIVDQFLDRKLKNQEKLTYDWFCGRLRWILPCCVAEDIASDRIDFCHTGPNLPL